MSTDDDLRKLAEKRVKAKQDLRSYLGFWALVSAISVGVWLFATPGVYFWPIWAIGGMGVAVPFMALEAYGKKRVLSEADIDAEVKKMKGEG